MLRQVTLIALVSLTLQTGCADETTPAPAATKASEAASSVMPVSPAPAEARLYFISPGDGATVASPIRVQFGLRGMGVAPAGSDVAKTGHHHLLIDLDELPDLSAPLPATDQIRHFGGGQTETTIELPPGKHSLQLVLGNYAHVPHSPPVMSQRITINVAPPTE